MYVHTSSICIRKISPIYLHPLICIYNRYQWIICSMDSHIYIYILVGGLEHVFFPHHIGNNHHPNWLIFFRGVGIPPTSIYIYSPYNALKHFLGGEHHLQMIILRINGVFSSQGRLRQRSRRRLPRDSPFFTIHEAFSIARYTHRNI